MQANQVIELAFEKYNPDQLAVAFNGGKDGLVLLSLLQKYAVLPLVFYIAEENPMEELVLYRNTIAQEHNFELHKFKNLKEMHLKHPQIKGIFMGTRKTDPDGADLTYFKKTDPAWGDFVRINPILDWSYHQVWDYIQKHQLNYCQLYAKGYTSLGCQHNTKPNPFLKEGDSYKPAWELINGEDERQGRV